MAASVMCGGADRRRGPISRGEFDGAGNGDSDDDNAGKGDVDNDGAGATSATAERE
jgi:hypothetical protein